MEVRRRSIAEKGWSLYWAAAGLIRLRTTIDFLRQRRQADEEWTTSRPARLRGLGSATRLSILPLVEFYSADERLATEPGVSYLVTVDGTRFLFDVGRNVHREHPSPLLRNMETLGIGLDSLDAIFISHCHLDHVGGTEEMRRSTFALSAGPVDLTGIPAYVPAAMSHPSANVEVSTGPRKLAEGVATTGPLTRALWLMGAVAEQALLVNVEDKGLVIVVGCGHPLLPRLMARAEAVTGVPPYGVVGGLHFPVTGSRVGKGGQNILGNGKLPWQRITRREAQETAALLGRLDLGLVALSAHDSCDWSLEMFAGTLGDRCHILRVGKEVVIA
jgi:7,8-dihydropterin-6-yl-methyl-4-(beta-D-ribofuranosyl)aminobenzene 5'-phosphate synthase